MPLLYRLQIKRLLKERGEHALADRINETGEKILRCFVTGDVACRYGTDADAFTGYPPKISMCRLCSAT